MPYLGTLVEWNDQRGFGFIQADAGAGGERMFVHISAFQPKPMPPARPYVGQRVEFAVGIDNGKKRAQQVVWRQGVRSTSAKVSRRAAVPAQQDSRRSESVGPSAAAGTYLSIIGFIAVFLLVALLWGVPRWVASLYAVMSLMAFFAYWKDKVAAQAGHWRTAESTLHSLAVLGGWPGALLAQQWLRHKSSKAQFRSIFWLTVGLNVTAFVWLHSPRGRDWLPALQV